MQSPIRLDNGIDDSNKTSETMKQIKSKERVENHGEVFTPEWLVNEMLDLVEDEVEQIESRVLEPACGNGNFLVQVLQRKLTTIKSNYRKSKIERGNRALHALMCIYGIELLADNVIECQNNLLEIFTKHLGLAHSDDMYIAALYVLRRNIIHGDAIKMRTHDNKPIVFAEWKYNSKGTFARRDFLFEDLAKTRELREGSSLFSQEENNGTLEPTYLFKPIATYDMMTLQNLIACEIESQRKAA